MILVLKSGSLVLFGTFEFYTLVRNRGVESINWDLLFFPLRSRLSVDFGLDKQDPWKCLSKERTRQALLRMTICSVSSLSRDVRSLWSFLLSTYILYHFCPVWSSVFMTVDMVKHSTKAF